MTDRRRAFRVVDLFEEALCEYTGAPFAVAVDSCTNALFLALLYEKRRLGAAQVLQLPRRNYIGVYQAARNAGWSVEWTNELWGGSYLIEPTKVIDAAKAFHEDCYVPSYLYCVSFQAAKRLPIGRAGAILHDDEKFDVWARRARLDGRGEGEAYKDARFTTPGYHMYMSPPDAARGLWLLTYLDDDDQGDWTEYPDLSMLV